MLVGTITDDMLSYNRASAATFFARLEFPPYVDPIFWIEYPNIMPDYTDGDSDVRVRGTRY